MDIHGYVNSIRTLYISGQTTEHSFRPALHQLFQNISADLTVINEPKRLTDVGAPDFVFNRKGVSIGWCEAKDIGKDIRHFSDTDYSKEQKDRYTRGLPNLIYTNGLDFEFIRNGESIAFIAIADLIPSLPLRQENLSTLKDLLRDFAQVTPITITSAKQLAEMMAGKAVLVKDIMGRALLSDRKDDTPTDLNGQYEAFKDNLIHEITEHEFVEMYAETIAYGLFAARLQDRSLDTFSRTEAMELLPKTNPFLRSLFGYIAGVDLDDRIRWVIDELCEVFRATDLHEILRDFGTFTGREDPFLHFYETFLAEYSPEKRKARGVWYTPEPVVHFIIRAVDDVLKAEFGLNDGLADTSKISIDWHSSRIDKEGKNAPIRKDIHRVQILDPATGTGTFLAEVIKLVAKRVQSVAPGQWSQYVENDLIPRVHGFELLMAGYAMCHMKIGMVLRELGYKPAPKPPRLRVFLSNSLEEADPIEHSLFARWLADEARAASEIKHRVPIMCVVGNPPYSAISQNRGKWIADKIEDYKYVNGVHFGERKHWLHDDYVKFIRLGEHMISENGEGILAFITAHGFLDSPTFRGMRWHLLNTFDSIYVLDLHGNANKKETCPDGSPDKNVFDIMQGVSIFVAAKKRSKENEEKPLSKLFHGELWGTRESKYQSLWSGRVSDLAPQSLPLKPDVYSFVPRNYNAEDSYSAGFAVPELMEKYVTGIVTMGDRFAIGNTPEVLRRNIRYLLESGCTADELKERYGLGKNYAPWIVENRGSIEFDEEKITPISYRPFDTRWTYYDNKVLWRWREAVMRNLVGRENINLMVTRQTKETVGGFVVRTIAGHKAFSRYDSTYNFPLYVYPRETSLSRTVEVNFREEVYRDIRERAGLGQRAGTAGNVHPLSEGSGESRCDEVKVLDYIYGVLHSQEYRTLYKEFLKTEFPRIPYPRDAESFRDISALGEILRRLHLLDEGAIGDTPYPFEGDVAEADRDCLVENVKFQNGTVWINEKQGFSNVSLEIWEFYIGGYQPAQHWLRERERHALSWEDIRHYQKIVKALSETIRVMERIEIPLD